MKICQQLLSCVLIGNGLPPMMKRLTTDIYKVLYKFTGAKWFSVLFAVAYITLLNVITLQGLVLLLQGWMSILRFLQKLFAFPYYFIIAVAVFAVNYISILPLKNLKKERHKKPLIIPVIVYTLVCILLYLYIHYSDKIN